MEQGGRFPPSIDFGEELRLVSSGVVDLDGAGSSWAIYSDFLGRHLFCVEGLSADLTPTECFSRAIAFGTESFLSDQGSLVTLELAGGGISANSRALSAYNLRFFDLRSAKIVSPKREVFGIEYVICGFHEASYADVRIPFDDCAVHLRTSDWVSASNDMAQAFRVPGGSASITVYADDHVKCERVKNCFMHAMTIVCGTQVSSGAKILHHSEDSSDFSVILNRQIVRPYLAEAPVLDESFIKASVSAFEKMSSLNSDDVESARKVALLTVEATNQASFVEVRALNCCMVVDELVNRFHRAEKPGLISSKDGVKGRLARFVKDELLGCQLNSLSSEEKKQALVAIEEACEKFWGVAKASLARRIFEMSEAVDAKISSEEAKTFVRYRNDLVHRRELKNKGGKSDGQEGDSPEGWARYCEMLAVMDKLVIGYFCGTSFLRERAKLLADRYR